jgi:hypothetical protein
VLAVLLSHSAVGTKSQNIGYNTIASKCAAQPLDKKVNRNFSVPIRMLKISPPQLVKCNVTILGGKEEHFDLLLINYKYLLRTLPTSP